MTANSFHHKKVENNVCIHSYAHERAPCLAASSTRIFTPEFLVLNIPKGREQFKHYHLNREKEKRCSHNVLHLPF